MKGEAPVFMFCRSLSSLTCCRRQAFVTSLDQIFFQNEFW